MADPLTLIATVVDKATGPLAAIHRAMTNMARGGARELTDLNKGVSYLGNELRTAAIPALQAFGISSLSVTGSLVGMGVALRGVTKDAMQMKYMSEEMHLSTDAVEDFQKVAGALHIDNATGALKHFAAMMLEVRDRTAAFLELRNELARSGRVDIAEELFDLSKMKNWDQALERAIELLGTTKDATTAAYLAIKLFGVEAVRRMGETTEGATKYAAILKEFPAIVRLNTEAYTALDKQFARLSWNTDNLKNTVLNAGLMDIFAGWTKEFNAFLELNQEEIGSGFINFFKQLGEAFATTRQEWEAIKPIFDFLQRVAYGDSGKGGGVMNAGFTLRQKIRELVGLPREDQEEAKPEEPTPPPRSTKNNKEEPRNWLDQFQDWMTRPRDNAEPKGWWEQPVANEPAMPQTTPPAAPPPTGLPAPVSEPAAPGEEKPNWLLRVLRGQIRPDQEDEIPATATPRSGGLPGGVDYFPRPGAAGPAGAPVPEGAADAGLPAYEAGKGMAAGLRDELARAAGTKAADDETAPGEPDKGRKSIADYFAWQAGPGAAGTEPSKGPELTIPPPPPRADPEQIRLINRALSASTGSRGFDGSARISVDVNAPRGTRVKADADGLFKEIELNRSTQMSPAIDEGED
jgi:hypothetical protein